MYLSTQSQNVFQPASSSYPSVESAGHNMAQRQPSAADLVQFKNVTLCDDDKVAVRFLQGADCQLETAILNFFDDKNRYDQSFDHTDFAPGSSGNFPGTSAQHSFNIIPDDGNLAPTRPPSRSSLSVHMDPQESGVIVSSNEAYGRNFGPATRNHYDPSRWALTVAAPADSIPEVGITDRIRSPGQPVVMKPTHDRDPLAPFISIIGHIPLARKVLIEFGESLSDYGDNPNWWSGSPIATAEVSDGPLSEPEIAPFVHEVHRLMAFMRHSTRLFGSVEPLAQLKLMHEAPWPLGVELRNLSEEMLCRDKIDRFLAALSYAAKGMPNGEQADQLMQGVLKLDGIDALFNHLDIRMNLSANREPEDKNIYDAIDSMLWFNDPDGEREGDFCLVRLPPILVMRIRNMDDQIPNLDVNVAAEVYVDRYAGPHMDRMKQMRREMAGCRHLVTSFDAQIQSLIFVEIGGEKHSSEKLLKGSIEYLRRDFPPDTDSESDGSTAMEQDEADGIDAGESKELAEKLEQLLNRLREKINDLDAEKASALSKLAQLSKQLKPQQQQEEEGEIGAGASTSTGSPADARLELRYRLRGVVPNSRTVIMHCPRSSSVADGEEPVPNAEEWVWFLVEFHGRGVDKRIVDVDEVLRLARSTRDVTLVYANDEASESQEMQIPTALKKFVDQDNLTFEKEQTEFNRGWQAQSGWSDDEEDVVELGPPPPYDGGHDLTGLGDLGDGDVEIGGVEMGGIEMGGVEMGDVEGEDGDEAIYMGIEGGDTHVASELPNLAGSGQSDVSDLSAASVRTILPAGPSEAASSAWSADARAKGLAEGATTGGVPRQRTAEAALGVMRASDAAAALQATTQQAESSSSSMDVEMLDASGGMSTPSREATPLPPQQQQEHGSGGAAAREMPPPLPPREGQPPASSAKRSTGATMEGEGKDVKKGKISWRRIKGGMKSQ